MALNINALGANKIMDADETLRVLSTHKEDLNKVFNASPRLHPFARGIRVHVLYEREEFTGEVTGYCRTAKGDWALGVNIDLDKGGHLNKLFFARKNPVFSLNLKHYKIKPSTRNTTLLQMTAPLFKQA